jgi:hypothetical protein
LIDGLVKGESEKALVEFIKSCEYGLQLPFSLINQIKYGHQTGNKHRLVLDFRLTEPAAIGTGKALKVKF